MDWVDPVSDGNGYFSDSRYVRLAVTASGNLGIARVHIYRWDKVLLHHADIINLTSAPYVWELDTTTLYLGWNEIDVDAFDVAGNVSNHQFIFLYRMDLIYLPFIRLK